MKTYLLVLFLFTVAYRAFGGFSETGLAFVAIILGEVCITNVESLVGEAGDMAAECLCVG